MANVYIAQSQAGTGDGSSCGNAKAASFFNSGGNWGAGATQIGPGTTVHLCGTITSDLSFQGSGSAGGSSNCGGTLSTAVACTPITLDGTGATINAQVLTGTSQYLVIHGGSWGAPAADDCLGAGNNPTNAINIRGNYITIDAVDIENTISGLVYIDQNGASGMPHNIRLQNSILKNTTSSTVCQIDLFDNSGAYDITAVGNYFENRSSDNASQSHNDVTQFWNGPQGRAYNFTFAYNEVVLNATTQHDVSFTMLEYAGTGNIDLIGNLFICKQGANGGNGVAMDGNTAGTTIHIYNNTLVEKSNSCANLFNLTTAGTFYMQNNLVYDTDQTALTGGGVTAGNRSHNLWYLAGSGSLPSCTGTVGDICGSNPLFTNFAGNDFSLQSTSPAKGAGAALPSPYNSSPYNQGFAPGATWPNPTLATRSTWDIGAYVYGAGVSAVATPTDSPGEGTYTSVQTVALSDSTSGAIICYTTNGTTPAATVAGTCDAGSMTFSSGFMVSSTTTLKAIGTMAGKPNSGILTSVYTINLPSTASFAVSGGVSLSGGAHP